MTFPKLLKILFVLICFFSISISCSKFEEGPVISLLPVKNRLSREWKVEYVINSASGIRHSADYESWILSLDKGGTFTNKIFYNQQEINYNGKWDLTSKNRLSFEYNSTPGSITEYYTILRLTKKELWLKDEVQEIHYYSE